MRVYLRFVKVAFRQSLACRADYALWMVSGIPRIIIRTNLWQALFRSRATVDAITLSDMASYVVISMVVGSLTQSGIGERLVWAVREGSISVSPIGPMSITLAMMCEELGETCSRTLITVLPVVAAASAFLGFRLPADPLMAAAFALSVAGGMILSFSTDGVLGLLVFWLKDFGSTTCARPRPASRRRGSHTPSWTTSPRSP